MALLSSTCVAPQGRDPPNTIAEINNYIHTGSLVITSNLGNEPVCLTVHITDFSER